MVKRTRISQGHLIALEPRMMFDGAAVVTAAATLSSSDVLDNGPTDPGFFGAANNRLTADTVPDIGLVPPTTLTQDIEGSAIGSSDGLVVDMPPPNDQSSYDSGSIVAGGRDDSPVMIDADDIDLSNRMVLERELKQEQDQLAGLELRSERLILRAPIAGIVTDLSPDIHSGRWLGGAEAIAYVVTSDDYDIQAYVSEEDIWRISKDARGRFIPDDPVQASRAAKLVEKSTNAVERIDQPILASVNGGPIASDKDENILRPRSALYRVRLIASKKTYKDGEALQLTPGSVEISATGRSVAGGLLDKVTRIFRSEASLSN